MAAVEDTQIRIPPSQPEMRLFVWEHDIGCQLCGITHPEAWERVWVDRLGPGAICSGCAKLPERARLRRIVGL
jgi:hypothetical protein